MKLNYFQMGTGPSLIILHGLFGSASNFRTLVKYFSPHYTVYCLDLRNHGNSPHDDDTSLEAMASDIIEFMDDHALNNVALMGHSLGGKVAMQVALNFQTRISKLIIGDIAPVAYPHHHDQIFEGLNAVSRLAPTSRKEAEKILADYVDTHEVRLFLLTNFTRNEDNKFIWRINVDGLHKGYENIASAPNGAPFYGKSLFIRGSLSHYVKDDYFEAIYDLFPKAEIITLEGAGHWLHAEKPVEYAEMVLNFLDEE